MPDIRAPNPDSAAKRAAVERFSTAAVAVLARYLDLAPFVGVVHRRRSHSGSQNGGIRKAIMKLVSDGLLCQSSYGRSARSTRGSLVTIFARFDKVYLL
jgi:hypothetical protein